MSGECDQCGEKTLECKCNQRLEKMSQITKEESYIWREGIERLLMIFKKMHDEQGTDMMMLGRDEDVNLLFFKGSTEDLKAVEALLKCRRANR